MRRSKNNWQSLGKLFSGDIKLSLLHANSLTQAEWKSVVEFAFRERVAPELSARLGQLGVEEKLPKDWLEALKASHQLNEMIHSQYREVFRDVLVACSAIDIQPMVLKGGIDIISLDDSINASRVALDLDILVGEHQAGKLQRELIGVGFKEDSQFKLNSRHEKHHHLAPLWHKTHNLYVEIHRSLGSEDQFHYLNKNIFSDPETRDLDGLVYLVPSLSFRVLHNFIGILNDESNGGGRSFRLLLDLYRLTMKLTESGLEISHLMEQRAQSAREWKHLRYFLSHVFEADPTRESFALQSFLRMHLFWLSKDYRILRLLAFVGSDLRRASKQENFFQKIVDPMSYKKAMAACLRYVKN